MLNALVWNLLLTAGLAILLGAFCHLPWLRRRPALTHWLWLLLLAKLVTPPLIEVPLLPAVDENEKTVAAALAPRRPTASTESPTVLPAAPPQVWELSAEEGPELAVEPPRPVPADVGSSSTLDGKAVAAQEPVIPRAGPQPARSIAWSGALLALSFVGTCLLATIYGLRAVRFHRWLERAGTDSPVLAQCCREVAASMGVGGELRSCLVEIRMTPLLWGWFRPIVAVPRQLLDEFRPEQLRSILAHELAHLVRRDHWANAFACVVKALMWWNPVVWWADRELRVAQEMCCDAIAIDRCGVKRSSYAATLLMALDFLRPPVVSSRLALGMGSRGTILRRFEMIGDHELSYRMSRWGILGLLVLGTALACIPVRGQEEKAPSETATGKTEAAATSESAAKGEQNTGTRPRGNCSISGKVVSAETGDPIRGARVYLFYTVSHSPIFVDVASDGSFEIENIPSGPHTLCTLNTPGYQSVVYRPEGESGQLAYFSLKAGEHRSGVSLKAKRAYRISGKIRDAQGAIPEDVDDLSVSAIEKSGEYYRESHSSSVKQDDGSYLIDGLDGQPVYVIVTNPSAESEGNNRPPVYYPRTFSRSKAKLVVFDEDRTAEGVDITLRTRGGAVFQGKVVNESGDPIPEAFVVVHRRDMFGGNLTAYTDEQGRYRIQGLGEGEFLVHVDAAHRGYVRLRSPLEIDDARKRVSRDFTLSKGVLISGRFVDEEGGDWQIGSSHGYAHVLRSGDEGPIFSSSGLFNKYGPENAAENRGSPFTAGEGEYSTGYMTFPTKSTFAIHGMKPGAVRLGFLPKKEDQQVLDIRYQGQNLLVSQLSTSPGETIKDVVIVIGKRKPGEAPATASNVLTLKDGETGRIKVAENVTPVAEISITPRFDDGRTSLELEAVDAKGRPIDDTKVTTRDAHDGRTFAINLGSPFPVEGRQILAVAMLTPKRRGDDFVDVEVKVAFSPMRSPEELEARPLMPGKQGRQSADIHKIARLIAEYQLDTGRYPENLKALNQELPKDVYSPTGEGYHYQPQHSRYILSGCGKDGVHGNDDDNVIVCFRGKTSSGLRGSIFPLEPLEDALGQEETVLGERRHGDCSIGGRVVSAATGQPISHAKVQLYDMNTQAPILIDVAQDGTFVFKDIAQGPYLLMTITTTGYQNVIYNPEGSSDQFPTFTLNEGEQRLDLVLKAEQACRISGKILDADGNVPKEAGSLSVLAWFQKDGSYQCNLGLARPTSSGSYTIDGLDGRPVYVMVIDLQAAKEGRHFPPVYYPGTFSQSKATQISFGSDRSIENIDISLTAEVGLILEGKVVDEAGDPVPEALVLVHPSEMVFAHSTTYTDENGRYQVRGLGQGGYLVHVDAAHRGYVRTRTTVALDDASKQTTRDFILTKGVLISGKLVDKAGNDWEIGKSFGTATVGDQAEEDPAFGRTASNKYGPVNVGAYTGSPISTGEGGYRSGTMIFPTKSTFAIHGMIPGHTQLQFSPRKEGQAVLEIRYKAKNVLQTGLDTKRGETIEGVEIVIGPASGTADKR